MTSPMRRPDQSPGGPEQDPVPTRLRLVPETEGPNRPEPPESRWLSRAMKMGAELAVVTILCLIFFAGFLGLQSVIFPNGVPLRNILIESGETVAPTESRPGSTGGLVARGALGGAAVVARLSVMNPDVKARGGDEITWRPARTGVDLHDQDGVITAARGSALISFDKDNVLRLGANTLIIIRQPSLGLGETTRRPSVLVQAGELFATITRSAEETTRLRIEVPGGSAEIATPESGGGATSFKVTVDAEQRPSVAVYQGTAVIETGTSTVRIGPRQYATFDESGAVAAPKPLPPAPATQAPPPETKFVYLDLPPQVTFSWSASAEADHYRLRVARDAQFHRIALDERVAGNRFQCGSLKSGDYYWQVAACTPVVDGPASETRRIVITQVAEGPPLDVTLPETVVTADRLTVAGATGPGASVFIAGEPVPVDAAGRFEFEVRLRPGVNVVVVEARDAAGNVSYRSQIVNARY